MQRKSSKLISTGLILSVVIILVIIAKKTQVSQKELLLAMNSETEYLDDKKEEKPKLKILSFIDEAGYATDWEATEEWGCCLYQYDCRQKFTVKKLFCMDSVTGDYFVSTDGEQFYFADCSQKNGGIWKLDIENQTKEKVLIEPITNIFFLENGIYATGHALHAEDCVPIYYSATGKEWNMIGSIGEEDMDDLSVTAMCRYDEKLYAATGYALYMSADEGVTWKKVFQPQEVVGDFVILNDKMYFPSYEKGGFCVMEGENSYKKFSFELNGNSSMNFWASDAFVSDKDCLVAGTATENESAEMWVFVWNDETQSLEGSMQIEDTEKLIGITGNTIYLYNYKTGECSKKVWSD